MSTVDIISYEFFEDFGDGGIVDDLIDECGEMSPLSSLISTILPLPFSFNIFLFPHLSSASFFASFIFFLVSTLSFI